MGFEGQASGKVILLGEHAVVHGVPALAASIGQGAWASARAAEAPSLCIADASGAWTLDPDSELLRAYRALSDRVGISAEARARIDIPTRAGLGSSACLGVALARALMASRAMPFDDGEVVEAAMAWERVFHGNPSGIDVAVATHGGCIEFSRSAGVKRVHLTTPIPLCVGDTGTRSSTREMVELVSLALRRHKGAGSDVLEGIGACVGSARGALASGDWGAVARAMNDNQEWLRVLGLSTPESDALCREAQSAGALAAKVTGAGGGGCVIALAPGRQHDVLEAWQSAGFRAFVVDAGV